MDRRRSSTPRRSSRRRHGRHRSHGRRERRSSSHHRDDRNRHDWYQDDLDRYGRRRDARYRDESHPRDRHRDRRDRSQERRGIRDRDDLCRNCWSEFSQRHVRRLDDARRAREELREERRRATRRQSRSRDRTLSPTRAELDPEGHMYRYIMDEELEHEAKERYRPGGFHPIMPGDMLGHHGRYEVVDKLGWGNRSTVWLCEDSETGLWRAIKVLQAVDSTEENRELKIIKLLEHVDREELERNHIGLPESYFWQHGPNGKHLCFVSKLVASQHSIPPSGYGIHSPTLLIDLCFQLATAVKYLHDKGICHGDIRIENMAMRLDDAVEKLSRREMDKYLGEPAIVSEVERISGRPAYPHAPDYITMCASTRTLESTFRTGQLVLIDFGLYYETSELPLEQMSYRSNAAPEMLFKRSPSGPATDLWALACVMLQLRTRNYLVGEDEPWSRVLRKMEWRWGPLPATYKDKISNLLEEVEEYSVDEMRQTPWQPGDPLAIPISRDVYQETKDEPSHRMWTIQGYLRRVQQRSKHHLTEVLGALEGGQFTFYDGTSDEYSSDTEDNFVGLTGAEATKRPRTTESPKPPGDGRTSPKPTVPEKEVEADVQRAIGRGRSYKKGAFPDSSNPCICDWDVSSRLRGTRIGINGSCTAEQHWAGDPEQIIVWEMSKNEQRVFGDLLEGIFKYDPEDRLTTEQVFNHRWFKQRREAHGK